ncbi:SAM-dependent methyltransferase [Marmoricola sp. URHA0025 HA25]
MASASASDDDDVASTATDEYAQRLSSTPLWKRALGTQAPYRWNLRRQDLGRTLDVGCGVGRNLAWLDPGSVGVDHNASAVTIARSRGLTALTVEEWQDSPHRVPESFDGLLFAHVIEHVASDSAAGLVDDYLPYLRPGGTVFFICPQERGFASDPTHVSWTTGPMLMDLASDLGLVAEQWRSFPLPRVAGRWFTYNEFCVRARKH